MPKIIQANENGTLIVPAGLVQPGAKYTVEPRGDVVILRRELSNGNTWWETTTPDQRIAWLEEWIANLPPAPALPREATHRDSMYD